MSATEIIKELSKLSEAERQEVLSKLRDLVHRDEEIAGCNHPAAEGATPLNRLEQTIIAIISSNPARAGHPLSLRLRGFAGDEMGSGASGDQECFLTQSIRR